LVGHLPRLLSQLAIAFDQVSTQPLILTSKLVDFLRRAPLGHVSDGTPIRRSVQGPLNCCKAKLPIVVAKNSREGRSSPTSHTLLTEC
jgi:hypothetical protein